MRRKSSRNLAKSSPEKVQQTEAPVRKSRRTIKRRRRSSSSETGNSEEDQEVKVVENVSAEGENSKNDSLIADDTEKPEDVQFKFNLSRDSTSSPKRRSKDRQRKAGNSQEEKLPNQEVMPTRRSRRRGSPKIEEPTHREDEEDKKGKGKSKSKNKSKIEKIHPLNEPEAHNEREISENVQVTPESPQTNTDNPVDIEHVTVIENVENSEDGTKGETDNKQVEEATRTRVDHSSPKHTNNASNNNKLKGNTSLKLDESEDASENSSNHPSDQQNQSNESTNQSPDKETGEVLTDIVNQECIGSWEEKDENVPVTHTGESNENTQEEILVSSTEEIKFSGENDQVMEVVQSEIVVRHAKDNESTMEEVNINVQYTNIVREERKHEEQEVVEEQAESEQKQPENESEKSVSTKEKQGEEDIEREKQESDKEPEQDKESVMEEPQTEEDQKNAMEEAEIEKDQEKSMEAPETEKDQVNTMVEPEEIEKDQDNTMDEPETEKDQENTMDVPDTEKDQESSMEEPETKKKEQIIKEDDIHEKEDLEMETRNSIFTAEGRNFKNQADKKPETKTKSRKKKVEISRNFDDANRRTVIHRRKWGNAPVGLDLISPHLIPVDLDTIKSFCQHVHFLEETEVTLEHGETKDRRRSLAEHREKKVERKVSLDDSVRPVYGSQFSDNSVKSDDNLEAEIDKSNIIAMNRKISIVDDSASKLKPPPSPAKNSTSEVLYITNLVRPFTLKQLKELLERTGKIIENGFWTDRIKSKCYVQYETVEEAESTRNALHGVHWPIGNGKKLMIDYATPTDLENARNPPPPPPPPAPVVPEENKNDKEDNEEQKKLKQEEEELTKEHEREREREKERHRSEYVREWDVGKENMHRRHSRSRERHEKRRHSNRSPSPIDDFMSRKQKKIEEQPPQKLMDDLFQKTKATPSIYWQPLTPEEIATKQQQRLERMAEHKRRMEETSRTRAEYGRGGPYRRRHD